MRNWKACIIAAGMMGGMMASIASGFAVDDSPSLYDRLGGRSAIQSVVEDFVVRIFADERVNEWFANARNSPERTAAYKSSLSAFICHNTGGPCQYRGPDMSALHQGRGITVEAFDAVVEDLTASLKKLNVPAREQADLLGLLAPLKPEIVQH